MSLSMAIDQIQRASWWNDPSEPWSSNRATREKSEETRTKMANIIASAGKPVLVQDLAKELGVPLMSARNFGMQLVDSGIAARCEIRGLSALVLCGVKK